VIGQPRRGRLLCRRVLLAAKGIAAKGAAIQAGDVIDDELSRAVVAYIRGAGLAWPHRSLDAVAGAMGADAAERLGPHLKRLADEAVYWPVDWNRHDLLSAMEVVRDGLAERHPELSSEAAEALIWDFSYAHW
jgi:hypothetical protein